MSTLHIVFLSLAISQMLVLASYIFMYHWRSVLGLLAGGLVLTLISGLLGEGLNSLVNSQSSPWLIYFTMALNRVGNISMFLVWMLSLKLFDDNFEISKVRIGIWLLIFTSLIMRSIGSYYAHYLIELSFFSNLVTWVYSQLVLIGFSLAAIYTAMEGWRRDLVIERRFERVIFVVCVAILLLLMGGNRSIWVLSLVSEGSYFPGMPVPMISYSVYAYCVTVALFLWAFRVVNLSFIRTPTGPNLHKVSNEQVARERDLIDQIKKVIADEKLYRNSNLTVRMLAENLNSQEYLVRRAINNHMGYRNFSEFLNHYRIDETIELLVGTNEPITNIGFDVGYTSLSSFYKAFKALNNTTPKDYRANHKPKI